MDDYLANIYGTGASEESLEKTAQADLLMKLASEEGIDLSGLDEDQLSALANQVIADNTDGGVDDQGGLEDGAGEASADEEAQAKFAEADFLGRVMAHSYTQELNKIAEEGGGNPFAAAGEKKKCEDCGKAECECPAAEKTATGPLGRAIQNMGGRVGPAQEEVPEAVKLAFATLKQYGYTE